jgi:hypothetical protein
MKKSIQMLTAILAITGLERDDSKFERILL